MSSAELGNYCLVFEQRLNGMDSDWLNSQFDSEGLVRNINARYKAPTYYQDGFATEIKQNFKIGQLLTDALGMEGSFKYLRISDSTRNEQAIFRLSSEAGLNYYYLSFGADSERIFVKDIYSLSGGEKLGKSIERLYVMNLSNEEDNFRHPLIEAMEPIQQIANLAEQKQYQKAYDYFMEQSLSVQKEKIALLMLLQLGNDIDSVHLEKACEKFKFFYPDDPLIALKRFEFSLEKNKLKESLLRLNELYEAVGGDPYLLVMKASLLREHQQDKDAVLALLAAMRQEPDNDEAYWILMDLYIKEGKFIETAALFAQMHEIFDENPADYIVHDAYDAFKDSPAYKNWILAHPLSEEKALNVDSLEKVFESLLETSHQHAH